MLLYKWIKQRDTLIKKPSVQFFIQMFLSKIGQFWSASASVLDFAVISLDFQRSTCKVALKPKFEQDLFHVITENISTYSIQTLDLLFCHVSFSSKAHCKVDILLTNSFISLMSSSLEWSMLHVCSMNSSWISIADKSCIRQNWSHKHGEEFRKICRWNFCNVISVIVLLYASCNDHYHDRRELRQFYKH